MQNSYVGAGILSIITESLYDNPIVVFREYVQNSVDSITKSEQHSKYAIKIWEQDDNLFFLDNGCGISENEFFHKMTTIGGSSKNKQKNLGYKGIGRLSGVPYCAKLYFANILDYKNQKIQLYSIDSELYDCIKTEKTETQMSFADLMQKIGKFYENYDFSQDGLINDAIKKYSTFLDDTNTGFLVVLKKISPVLKSTLNSESFFSDLQWLLPVNFSPDLYDSEQKELFEELTSDINTDIPSIRYCNIAFNDKQILRPIKKEMLRNYVCKSNFENFAIGFHSFNGDKICIDQKNFFSGIHIYMDNMLLCDENELLQNLDHYGLLSHSLNGQIQSVRGIGAMIYITDKINISANARRTFIEVTDNDSLRFLKLVAEFVNTIYDTRYALSNYSSAKLKLETNAQKMQHLKSIALENLKKLAKKNVQLANDDESTDFSDLDVSEQKKIVKKKISSQIDIKLREYLKTKNSFDYSRAYEDFFEWLKGRN